MASLKKYQAKRNFQKTKEPKGKIKKSTTKLHFCVQHHLARKDHYDLRLEWQGVLKSWAVPKGPSYNASDKRLAIMVEDHPLSYKNFEGTIPQGEYGGGTVMLWDEGFWEPISSVPKNFKMPSFKFVLKGKRLKGAWTLIHLEDDNWLLIKEKDNVKGFKDIKRLTTSVKTKRTMPEIAEGKKVPSKKDVKITITNPQKLIFPQEKITKGDLVNYYSKVAPRMLHFLKNRLISVIRAPEGIEKDIFYQKHLENNHTGIGHINLNNGDEDYYYLKNKAGLIAEVQRNSFEFHPWASTIKNIDQPNIMIFDLDPDEKLKLSELRQGVKDLKNILDELNLKSFLKTSGGKGYHVVVPLKKKMNWDQFRETAHQIALLMEAKWPDKYTTNMRKKNRRGKIYIDWVRNTKGATSVAPYSIRLRANCPVSFPLKWSELDKVKPNEITIALALKRLKRVDPWAHFFD